MGTFLGVLSDHSGESWSGSITGDSDYRTHAERLSRKRRRGREATIPSHASGSPGLFVGCSRLSFRKDIFGSCISKSIWREVLIWEMRK